MNFRTRLLNHERLLGAMVTLPGPETAEILAAAGCDWLFIDLEHSPLDFLDAQRLLQAAGQACAGVIRVPQADPLSLKKALDIGPAGIIVPQVNAPETAAQIVRWAKYAPLGERGVGIARAHGYGLDAAGYLARADDETAVIIQIEHIEAVNRIDEILAVAGVDALFIGPYDLSTSMGKMGQVDDPAVVAAIDRVTEAARRAGRPLGIFGVSAEPLRRYAGRGYTLLTAGIDAMLLAQAVRGQIETMRGWREDRGA